MSKKILALALTLVMALTLSAAVFAADEPQVDGTQIVTTKVTANPYYTVKIPANTSIPGGSVSTHIGDVEVTVTDAWDFGNSNMRVMVEFNGENGNKYFTCDDPAITYRLPYNFSTEKKPDGNGHASGLSTQSFSEDDRTKIVPVYMNVLAEDWKAAPEGDYTTRVVYTSKLHEVS